MSDLPNGYEVFELAWRGCWHYRRAGDEKTTSKCYDDEHAARMGAREEHKRWAAFLRAATC